MEISATYAYVLVANVGGMGEWLENGKYLLLNGRAGGRSKVGVQGGQEGCLGMDMYPLTREYANSYPETALRILLHVKKVV